MKPHTAKCLVRALLRWQVAAAVVLLALLAVVFVVQSRKDRRSGDVLRAVSYSTIEHVLFGLEQYRTDYGVYPPADSRGIVGALAGPHPPSGSPLGRGWRVRDPPGGRPVVDAQGRFVDQWGRPLIVRSRGPASRPVVYSAGTNGVDDGGRGDDVTAD